MYCSCVVIATSRERAVRERRGAGLRGVRPALEQPRQVQAPFDHIAPMNGFALNMLHVS